MDRLLGVLDGVRIGGGSHAEVVFLRDQGKVVKITGTRKQSLGEADAKSLAAAMVRYGELLQECGVRVPSPSEVRVTQNPETGYWLIVQTEPYSGEDMGVYLRIASSSAAEHIVDQLLSVLRGVFRRTVEDHHLQVGIDPKPANFTRATSDNLVFVDLFPPRFRDDGGKVFVEWPEPATPAGQEVAYFRHFHRQGVLRVLLGQLTRLRPELRPMFKEKIWAVAQEYELLDAFRNSLAERFMRALEQHRMNIIRRLRAEHMYDLREIACELVAASDGRYTCDDLDRFFHLSHFDDGLKSETVQRLQIVLLQMLQRLPLHLDTSR